MPRYRRYLLAALAAAHTAPAAAQGPAPVACWEVVVPSNGPEAPIQVNKCTGETWLLVKTPLTANGSSFTYIWEKLQRIDASPSLQVVVTPR